MEKIPMPIIGTLSEIIDNVYTQNELTQNLMIADIEDVSADGSSRKKRICDVFTSLNNRNDKNAIKKLLHFVEPLLKSQSPTNIEERTKFVQELIKHGILPVTYESEELDEESKNFLEQNIEVLPLLVTLPQNEQEMFKQRFDEIKACIENNIPLAAIFLIGSTLEGVLFAVAESKQSEYNAAQKAPKKNGAVKDLKDWTLNDLIEVSYELRFIANDMHKFSSALRTYRNYIHPREQIRSSFNPNIDTAKVSLQVLKGVFNNLKENGLM